MILLTPDPSTIMRRGGAARLLYSTSTFDIFSSLSLSFSPHLPSPLLSGVGMQGGPGGQLPPFFADLVDEFSYYSCRVVTMLATSGGGPPNPPLIFYINCPLISKILPTPLLPLSLSLSLSLSLPLSPSLSLSHSEKMSVLRSTPLLSRRSTRQPLRTETIIMMKRY